MATVPPFQASVFEPSTERDPDKRGAGEMSAQAHAEQMQAYAQAGKERALALGNRGPIRFDANGAIDAAILDAYWEHGFYVFENVIDDVELAELRAEVDAVLARAPAGPGAEHDLNGKPAVGREFTRDSFLFAAPLSDPLGGTSRYKGRHPVKMFEPEPMTDAPKYTIERIHGNLQIMDSALRLYGHHGLLSVSAAVNGADFVPYNEVSFVKEPRLGVSVAWHRDGTTHWDAEDWDAGAHGFNFMAQLYPSTAENGVWVIPGTHKQRVADIPGLVSASGSERINTAVPMICDAGSVVMSNRQLVHGSFANTSPDRRITLNMGFFPRKRVLNQTITRLDGQPDSFDEGRVRARSRIIKLAINARHQRFPEAPVYEYGPLADEADSLVWSEETRRTMLHDYNLLDMYI